MVSTLVFLALIALVYWRFYRQRSANPNPEEKTALVNFTATAVLAFIIAGKILSPQFLLWLLPVVPLVTGRGREVTWLVFLAACFATYFVFPVHYLELIPSPQSLVSIVLVLRNALLVVLFCCCW